ncbi:Nucleoside-diphosphate-sugar epimerase [Paraburkholderia unamae]|uniref:SDR family oxidoreductase n=1 Tax=Paraburkholderia unamae TaxID=219649 RepID=UPI001CB1B0EE|nr:SDR family oxidoreductase [Paraburkholderia unamae]CAG9262494.1 Nucleoside-diphosphate-sugar epimerase [Paraburkholderia unamae]
MRIFITGATGFLGSAVVRELIGAGHAVTGLVRSAHAVAPLEAVGARACRGTIEDTDILRQEAALADGVIHTAFFHALSHASLGIRARILFGGPPARIVERFAAAAVAVDQRAIETFGEALGARKASLVIAFPTMAMAAGRHALETDDADRAAVGGARARSEQAAVDLVRAGVNASIVGLPPTVHDETKLGLVTRLIEIARKKRMSACSGDALNRWAAVHRLDASRLFRLALEHGEPGARYHGAAEEGMPFRDIADAIGRYLDVPAVPLPAKDCARHFGWLAPFVAADNPVSSQLTQERLGWTPQHPSLMNDLAAALGDQGR